MYPFFIILLIFASIPEFKVPFFNYWDEFVTLIFMILPIVKNTSINKNVKKIYVPFIIMIFIGILNNILYPNIQEYNIAIFKDIIAFMKLPVVFLGMEMLYAEKDKTELLHKTANILKPIVIVSMIVAIIGLFVDIGVYTGEIRIVNCLQLFFPHPTFMVFSFIIILAIFVADSSSKNRIYIILSSIIILWGQRTKGYVAIMLFIFLSFILKFFDINKLFYIKNIRKRYVILGLIVASSIAWFVSREKVNEYMQYGIYAARPALYITSYKIAKEHFPLGIGFGTFASSLSGEYYSKAYTMYGISNVTGMTISRYNFLADTFWPYILGQFGFIGLFFYIKMIINMIKNHLVKTKSKDVFISFILLWGYALFTTTAEAFFTNSSSVQFAIIISIILKETKEPKENNNEKSFSKSF